MLAALCARFTDMRTLSALLRGAEATAREEGESEPSAEHLLLAAPRHPDGTAARVLSLLGVEAGDLRAAVAGQHVAALRGIGLEPDDLLTDDETPDPGPAPCLYRGRPSLHAVVQQVHAAHAEADGSLRSAHVLLAATRFARGTLPRTLRHLEVDPDELAVAARRELAATS